MSEQQLQAQPADLIGQVNWKKVDGLVPAIVQHAESGQVLMLGYMNEQALQQTLESRRVTFYSRSREQLWCKGETSGNTLELVSLALDCDQDTLLVQAQPLGPTCHLGTTSCFAGQPAPRAAILSELQQVIQARRGADPENSYVARLLSAEPRRVAQKVGEEGVEVALAGATQDDQALTEESADLLFHLMVLLSQRGLGLDAVLECLAQRRAS